MSSYVVNNGGGRRSLGSSTCLDEKGLKTSNNIGGYEFFEDVIAASLKVMYSPFQGENSSASGKVMAKTSYGSRVSS